MVKSAPANEEDARNAGLIPGLGRCPGGENGKPGKSHGHRSLAGYSLWGHKESDMTEQLSTRGIFTALSIYSTMCPKLISSWISLHPYSEEVVL